MVGDFGLRAQAVVVASGGIGGNHDLVRQQLAASGSARPPKHMVSGVPGARRRAHDRHRRAAGARLINRDRMWHYVEGHAELEADLARARHPHPAGPSSMWFDATGKRLPSPLYPGYDTLGTLAHLMATGHDYSWFVLTQKHHQEGVRAVGLRTEPGPDRKSWRSRRARHQQGAPEPVEAFKARVPTSSSRTNLPDLVEA